MAYRNCTIDEVRLAATDASEDSGAAGSASKGGPAGAGISPLRRKAHMAAGPGKEWDHVVELKLIAAVLNCLEVFPYTWPTWRQELADIFNAKHNLQILSSDDNRAKSRAVEKLMKGGLMQPSDLTWVANIRATWIKMRHAVLPKFPELAKRLNTMLGAPADK